MLFHSHSLILLCNVDVGGDEQDTIFLWMWENKKQPRWQIAETFLDETFSYPD